MQGWEEAGARTPSDHQSPDPQCGPMSVLLESYQVILMGIQR